MPNKPIRDLADSISTSLLLRAQSRDETAWRRLVDLYAPLVHRWCRRWGVRGDDTPDVVQDVFCRVATGVGRFRREAKGDTFRGWLWRIARNAATDYMLRAARQPEAIGGTSQQGKLQQVPEELPEEDPAYADEPLRLLHSMLELVRNDFQQRTWEIFWRSAVLGHETADIAGDFQMTPRAVRQAKHRVLNRLREECREL